MKHEKPKNGAFARIPAWIFRENRGIVIFKILRPSEFKVLGYLTSRSDNYTNETTSFTISGLGRATRLSRNTVRSSISVLENLKIIVIIQTKLGFTAARILFTTPDYSPRLLARLCTSVERLLKNLPPSGQNLSTCLLKNSTGKPATLPDSESVGLFNDPAWVIAP